MNDFSGTTEGNPTVYSILILMLVLMATGIAWLPNPWLALGIPLLIPAALTALRFPFLVCLLFILFSFFRIHEAFPQLNPLRIPQLLALASLVVLGWHIGISKKIDPFWTKELTVFSLFFGFVVIGVFLATDRGSAMATLTGSYSKIAIMLFAVAWLLRSPKDFALVSWAVIFAGIAIAGVAISNKLAGIGLVEGTRVTIGRDIGSMIGDPNDLALVLTFPLSFAASQILTPGQSNWVRLLGIVAYGIVVWAILCTQSRGGLLGIIAVTGILVWRQSTNKVLVISLGVVALTVLVAAAGISDRASGGAAESGIDESAMGRIYAWQAAFNMAMAHPFTGVGLDNFYANYYFYSPHWDGKNHAVHSTWFQVLAETGFLGFILFLVLVVTAFRCVQRSLSLLENFKDSSVQQLRIAGNALYSGLVGFCVSGTFLTQGFIWPFYILLGLSIALHKTIQHHTVGEIPHVK